MRALICVRSVVHSGNFKKIDVPVVTEHEFPFWVLKCAFTQIRETCSITNAI